MSLTTLRPHFQQLLLCRNRGCKEFDQLRSQMLYDQSNAPCIRVNMVILHQIGE
jgi:hypothetical protein